MTAARLHAFLLLAWAFVLMVVKRVLYRGPRGLALFEANFRDEHLWGLSADERSELPTFERCIACGLCNQNDGARVTASAGAYPGTMGLMLASSRSMPDFGAARAALAFISDEELAEKELQCPAAVPMRRVAAFIRAHS